MISAQSVLQTKLIGNMCRALGHRRTELIDGTDLWRIVFRVTHSSAALISNLKRIQALSPLCDRAKM